MDYKEEFCRIFSENVKRHGAKELLDWLCKTDFFTAPASTKYHCACTNGLVMHSLSVYDVLLEKHFDEETDSLESFTICALLHDLCKAQFYKVSTRNVKNEETGNWEKVPFYAVDDVFPYGHGEKSVFLIERFMKLRIEEAMAIRWHMGGFDDGGGFTISVAYQKYPLAVKLHLADLESTYLREKNTSTVNNR
ncbi:MAG: hydrolase [Acutalibacteraceae bacterium]